MQHWEAGRKVLGSHHFVMGWGVPQCTAESEAGKGAGRRPTSNLEAGEGLAKPPAADKGFPVPPPL